MSNLTVHPAKLLQGTLTVPGDKSISHRALLVSALIKGTYRISALLESEDVRRTLEAMQALGVSIRKEGGAFIVEGRGEKGLTPPHAPLEMGNSGTTARLLLGLLAGGPRAWRQAGSPFSATLRGDASLSRRPMQRVVDPLEKMGAAIEGKEGDKNHLPLTVHGRQLRGIEYALPVPSSQVKSAILLAAMGAEGPTRLVEAVATRDHTEKILVYLGAKLIREKQQLTLQPAGPLTARDLDVPGDISSAAFFLTAAALVPGSEVTVRGVGLNATRTGFLDILREMGAHVKVEGGEGSHHPSPLPRGEREDKGRWEPRGDVTVRSALLKAVSVEAQQIPQLIDELPLLMVAATQAKGVTRIEGAGELKVKETDRIQSMVAGLSALGARMHAEKETIVVEGPTRLRGTSVDACHDHRTAMALAVAGLLARGTTTVQGSEWMDISYPGFAKQLEALAR